MTSDDIPIIDGHAHPLLTPEAAARGPFVRFFTEAQDTETLARHAPHTLFYRQVLRDLAAFLACDPSEAAVQAAREALPFDVYLRRLLAEARVAAVLLDDGFPREESLTVTQVGAAGGVRAARVLRIESVAEDLIPAHDSLRSLTGALAAAVEAALPSPTLGDSRPADAPEGRPSVVALKSIVAYRTGLAIEPPRAGEAEAALAAARAAGQRARGRLAAKPLLDHLFIWAAQWAAARALPLQIHTGFGDRDLDLRLANPLHLRPLLEGGVLSRGPVVLLHAAYPYVREAAYLASVYPNVYVDLSLATPLLAGPGLTRVLDDLLALAPVTKLLYGSDAWGVPEWLWCAAGAARRALGEALAWLPAADARWATRRILHDNAAALYRFGH